MRAVRTIMATCAAVAMTAVSAIAHAQEEPGQFAFDPVYSNYAAIWNFWNSSNQVGSTAGVPAGVKFEGVAWDVSTTTYNNSFPGTHQVYLCSVTPDRCFNITGSASGWTDKFNDLDVANTKFFFYYRYYNASHPDGGTRYDPLIGSGVKPLLRGSLGAWWTPPAGTAAVNTLPLLSDQAQAK